MEQFPELMALTAPDLVEQRMVRQALDKFICDVLMAVSDMLSPRLISVDSPPSTLTIHAEIEACALRHPILSVDVDVITWDKFMRIILLNRVKRLNIKVQQRNVPSQYLFICLKDSADIG